MQLDHRGLQQELRPLTPGTLYLVGTDDYSSVEVISKTGDGDLVWVPPNPRSARIGPCHRGNVTWHCHSRNSAAALVSGARPA